MIVLAEQKKASVRVAFIGKKEAENLTYVSAAVSYTHLTLPTKA